MSAAGRHKHRGRWGVIWSEEGPGGRRWYFKLNEDGVCQQVDWRLTWHRALINVQWWVELG